MGFRVRTCGSVTVMVTYFRPTKEPVLVHELSTVLHLNAARNQVSSVGLVTRLQAGRSGVQSPAVARRISSLKRPDRRPLGLLFSEYQVFFLLGKAADA